MGKSQNSPFLEVLYMMITRIWIDILFLMEIYVYQRGAQEVSVK